MPFRYRTRLAVIALVIAVLAFGLREPGFGGTAGAGPQRDQTICQALAEACHQRPRRKKVRCLELCHTVSL